MLNLLSNAEKYSEKIKEIFVEIKKSKDYILINIHDRGIGIPPKHREKIFKEFYRVNDGLTAKVGGSGLGLSIARKIILDHKGDIVYFPRQGGGSIFQIKLKPEK
jgi:signal transduction histidine kinase